MFKNEPGWYGSFTREQAAGALANGTQVIKTNSEQGDTTPDGTPGVVLGSISSEGVIAYFVEWATAPGCAIGVMGLKVRAAPTPNYH